MKLLQQLKASVPDSVKFQVVQARNWRRDRKHAGGVSAFRPEPISSINAQYLRSDNPVLIDLESRYEKAAVFEHTFWHEWRKAVDLSRFRGEGHYLTQSVMHNPEAFYMAQRVYTEMRDDWGTLDVLTEDGAFGCHAHKIGGIVSSRDLLDSVIEITFLRKALGWGRGDAVRVLDIGAGYGRFAHRFLSIFTNASIANVDGVAESTFLCDFYTRFRGLTEDRCRTIPLDRLSGIGTGLDIATNIHSWSECSRATVRFWVRLIADLGIPYLFVVPHDQGFGTTERAGKDTFLPEIEAGGFKLVLSSDKFTGSHLRCNVEQARYYLFKHQ
jgi:putative sugar O-methyltransferase